MVHGCVDVHHIPAIGALRNEPCGILAQHVVIIFIGRGIALCAVGCERPFATHGVEWRWRDMHDLRAGFQNGLVQPAHAILKFLCAFGVKWLTPRLGEFLELYPDIQMTLLIDDRELDLAMREADVAIRMMPPRQPDLIQRHLATIKVKIYASKEYLERHGRPDTMA